MYIHTEGQLAAQQKVHGASSGNSYKHDIKIQQISLMEADNNTKQIQ